MEEFLFELASEAFDQLCEIGAALLFGAATAVIVHKVYTKVTRSNLPDFVSEAIRKSKCDALKKMIGQIIEIEVKSKQDNIISIAVLEAKYGQNDVAEKNEEIRIESTAGIDDSVPVGMRLKIHV